MRSLGTPNDKLFFVLSPSEERDSEPLLKRQKPTMMKEASWVKPPTVKAKYLVQICTLLTNEGVWDRKKTVYTADL